METSSRKTSPPPLEHHGNPPSPMLLQLQYLVCLLFNNTMPIPRRLSSDRFASHRAVNRYVCVFCRPLLIRIKVTPSRQTVVKNSPHKIHIPKRILRTATASLPTKFDLGYPDQSREFA
ncbi:hypothetical protein TSUD_34600 [Trifolium subterraneum]|uniref:Uncharacterized protein n=1 Tax=Trifolium subterraneum TaxID=3900 RepID=A0A2Z6PJ04_TRISU|nr:hypothetical protein TSUD_34600 [Trifolium subterraneum]